MYWNRCSLFFFRLPCFLIWWPKRLRCGAMWMVRSAGRLPLWRPRRVWRVWCCPTDQDRIPGAATLAGVLVGKWPNGHVLMDAWHFMISLYPWCYVNFGIRALCSTQEFLPPFACSLHSYQKSYLIIYILPCSCCTQSVQCLSRSDTVILTAKVSQAPMSQHVNMLAIVHVFLLPIRACLHAAKQNRFSMCQ